MSNSTSPIPSPPANRLLAHLPQDAYQRLERHLRPFRLEIKKVLFEVGGPIDYAYFPSLGVISMVTLMEDGSVIEVATVGKEGMACLLTPFGPATATGQFLVQVAGESLRIRADVLKAEATPDGPLREVMLLYQAAFTKQVVQAVACNGLHSVTQRCCRWLLMTHDRGMGNELDLTHEFLSQMLGVRRSSVTDVLLPLQGAGLIRSRRGTITVLDREGLEGNSCECYGAVEGEYDRLFGRAGG